MHRIIEFIPSIKGVYCIGIETRCMYVYVDKRNRCGGIGDIYGGRGRERIKFRFNLFNGKKSQASHLCGNGANECRIFIYPPSPSSVVRTRRSLCAIDCRWANYLRIRARVVKGTGGRYLLIIFRKKENSSDAF